MEVIWVELVKEIGPYLGLMFFFIWRDFKREERLEARNTELSNFIQKELLDLIEKYNEAVNDRES